MTVSLTCHLCSGKYLTLLVFRFARPVRSIVTHFSLLFITLCAFATAARGLTLSFQLLPETAYDVQGDAISGDGSVAIYSRRYSPAAYVWDVAQGKALSPPNSATRLWGISADGQTLIGTNPDVAVWRGTDPPVTLTNAHFASAVSADGAYFAGQTQELINPQTGFFGSTMTRWDASGAPQSLGRLFGGSEAIAYALSGDGSVAAGVGNLHLEIDGTIIYSYVRYSEVPLVWTADVGVRALAGFGSAGWAADVSRDGTAIVGYTTPITPSANMRATLWHDVPQLLQPQWSHSLAIDLGVLPGGARSFATGVNADGSVVVGWSDVANAGQHAFIWTSTTGMVDLHELIEAQGYTLGPGSRSSAAGVSDDGRTIIGTYSFGGGSQAFIVTLVVPEPTGLALGATGLTLLFGWYGLRSSRVKRGLFGN